MFADYLVLMTEGKKRPEKFWMMTCAIWSSVAYRQMFVFYHVKSF